MTDLSSPVAIKAKGILFLLLGVISAVLAWREHPTLKLATLMVLAIWSFCRFYYFAFIQGRVSHPSDGTCAGRSSQQPKRRG